MFAREREKVDVCLLVFRFMAPLLVEFYHVAHARQTKYLVLASGRFIAANVVIVVQKHERLNDTLCHGVTAWRGIVDYLNETM